MACLSGTLVRIEGLLSSRDGFIRGSSILPARSREPGHQPRPHCWRGRCAGERRWRARGFRQVGRLQNDLLTSVAQHSREDLHLVGAVHPLRIGVFPALRGRRASAAALGAFAVIGAATSPSSAQGGFLARRSEMPVGQWMQGRAPGVSSGRVSLPYA